MHYPAKPREQHIRLDHALGCSPFLGFGTQGKDQLQNLLGTQAQGGSQIEASSLKDQYRPIIT